MKKKAVFLDRDGVVVKEKNFVTSKDEIELYPFTAEAIKLLNKNDWLVIIVTNQSAVARGLISENELYEIHQKMIFDLGIEKARIDDIYYCPHHPGPIANAIEKYIQDCNCRKPKPGMIISAAKKFNINLEKSYIIGDAPRDIIAGEKAGLQTIGVKTGKAVKGEEVDPDFIFDNILIACKHIINNDN